MDDKPLAISAFDRILGTLHDLPDVRSTKPSTVATVLPILGNAQTFILRTYRQADSGSTLFLEVVDANGSIRVVIPPKAVAAIYRQADALKDRSTPASRARAAAKRARAKARAKKAARRTKREEVSH